MTVWKIVLNLDFIQVDLKIYEKFLIKIEGKNKFQVLRKTFCHF